MKLLLIYDFLPEGPVFYKLLVTLEELGKLQKFHGSIQGYTDDSISDDQWSWLSEFLDERKRRPIGLEQAMDISDCSALVYTGVYI